jgi:hypothetical protein
MLAAAFVKLKFFPENLFPKSPLFKPKSLRYVAIIRTCGDHKMLSIENFKFMDNISALASSYRRAIVA